MRILLVAAVLGFSAAGAAIAVPNGAYDVREAGSAGACARVCETDSLCQSWRLADNACALRAAVLGDEAGPASGLSSRAPAFAQSAAPLPEPAPLTVTAASVVKDADVPALDAGPMELSAPNPDFALLGGPEPGALRSRLRN